MKRSFVSEEHLVNEGVNMVKTFKSALCEHCFFFKFRKLLTLFFLCNCDIKRKIQYKSKEIKIYYFRKFLKQFYFSIKCSHMLLLS